MEFLNKLSLETRDRLSVSGVDPLSIYHSFKEDWRSTSPICLYHGKEVVAVAKLSSWNDGAYLSCFVVRDDFQRKGLGTKLMKYMFAVALLRGFKKVYLEVKKDNDIAISFFKRMGYKTVEEKEYTYLMKKVLQ